MSGQDMGGRLWLTLQSERWSSDAPLFWWEKATLTFIGRDTFRPEEIRLGRCT